VAFLKTARDRRKFVFRSVKPIYRYFKYVIASFPGVIGACA